MQYFPCQVSDGFAVYNDTKKHYESQNVIFQRLFPRSEESGLYPMDEMDVDAMINTVENEKRDDPKYFQEILVAGYSWWDHQSFSPIKLKFRLMITFIYE